MRRAAVLLATALAGSLAGPAVAAPAAGTFEASYTPTECGERVPIPVAVGETSLAVAAHATVPANDIVLRVFRNGASLGSADTLTSPEAYVATTLPPAAATDVVEAQVCPYNDPAVEAVAPYTVTGAYAWGSAPALPSLRPEPEPDGKKTVRVTALDDVLIPWGAAGAGADVAFPEGTYDKAELVLHDHPDGDAFDRLLTVEVDGVEMLRVITPRVDYTTRWDVTPYLSLLSGGTHHVFVHEESYLGRGHVVSVDFLLHQAKKTPPVATVIEAPYNYAGLGPRSGGGCRGNVGDVNPAYAAHIDETRSFDVPAADQPVRSATFYGYLTAHGCEEFWYSNLRPNPIRKVTFSIDGVPFADFVPTPYVYAFIGGDPNDPTWNAIDTAAWNTAQPVLADHGVYTGEGVIPPYVFDVTSQVKGLAAGAHTLSIRVENGNGVWFFSGQVLIAYGKGKP